MMQTLDSQAARTVLAPITHIYTDLDGTLLAPGGRLLANHRGHPSLSLAKALVRLKEVGLEIIIATGRDAVSSTEIMRLANLEQFIAEMGCITQFGYGAEAKKRFNLGEWHAEHFDQDYDHAADMTPHAMIGNSGELEALLGHFQGRLEVHSLVGSQREVTFMLRGCVDTTPGGEVDSLLAQYDLPLQLLDNGIIHPRNHGLLLVDEIHVYHLMPRGTGKGAAVAADLAEKGLAPEQTISIGDAEGDVEMGKHTGSFVLMNNGKGHALDSYVESHLANPTTLLKTSRPSADGWVEFAHALLEAKGQ